MRLKLDLHEIYNKNRDLDAALHAIIDELRRPARRRSRSFLVKAVVH